MKNSKMGGKATNCATILKHYKAPEKPVAADTIEPIDEIKFLQKLVRCKSLTPDTSEAQDILAETLNKMGFDCKIIEFKDPDYPDAPPVRNMFATLGEGEPSLNFCGHMDVVPIAEGWTVDPWGELHDKDGNKVEDSDDLDDDGIVYGRGTEDMKGGTAAFVASVSRILKENGGNTCDFPGRIGFAINGAEEFISMSKNGMRMLAKYLAEQGVSYDAGITGEPTSLEKVGDNYRAGRRGVANVDVLTKGSDKLDLLLSTVDKLEKNPLDNGTEDGYPPTDTVATGVSGGYMFKKDENKNEKTLSKEADATGFVNVTLKVIGKQGHSAFKDLTNNAIPHLSDLVSRLKKGSDAEFVGLQSGFIAENIAPGEAEACLKIKIAGGQTADETLDNLRKELTKDSKEREIKVSLEQQGEQKDTPNSENGRIKYNFRFNTNYESGTLFTEVERRIEKVAKEFESSVSAELDPFVIEPCKSKEGDFTKVFTDAIETATGIKSEKSFGGGATDTRYLVAEGVCKTAALDFGLVCKTMHSPDECIKAGEIRDLTNIFDRAMGSFFKIKERENTLTIEQRQEQARKTIIEARNKKLAPAVIKKALEQRTK